jgi:hypothetical protein
VKIMENFKIKLKGI